MSRFYSADAVQNLTLETAILRNMTWDVFVSHATKDDALAEEVARIIRGFGLTAWVDSDHFARKDDGPEMASRIQRVIKRSYCLLAVVTSTTRDSWWVPFEIGLAFDNNRFLSTYGDPRVPLPSFLEAWPRVKDHNELRSWCTIVKQKKATYTPTIETWGMRLKYSQVSNYDTEMKTMVERFPGRR